MLQVILDFIQENKLPEIIYLFKTWGQESAADYYISFPQTTSGHWPGMRLVLRKDIEGVWHVYKFHNTLTVGVTLTQGVISESPGKFVEDENKREN